MITLAATLAGIALCLGLLLWLFKDQQKLGRIIERDKAKSEVLKGVKEVVLIKDRLKNDKDYNTRVIERFTRPD